MSIPRWAKIGDVVGHDDRASVTGTLHDYSLMDTDEVFNLFIDSFHIHNHITVSLHWRDDYPWNQMWKKELWKHRMYWKVSRKSSSKKLKWSGKGDRFLAPNLKGLGLIIWAPYVCPSVHTCISVDSDFSEVYGSNVKLYQIDIIQNGGLAAILDVNTLGAVTRTPTGFP